MQRPAGEYSLEEPTPIVGIEAVVRSPGVCVPTNSYLKRLFVYPGAAIATAATNGAPMEIYRNGVDTGVIFRIPEGLAANTGDMLFLEAAHHVPFLPGDLLEAASDGEQILACNVRLTWVLHAA